MILNGHNYIDTQISHELLRRIPESVHNHVTSFVDFFYTYQIRINLSINGT